jgi:uncharacterized protein HemY
VVRTIALTPRRGRRRRLRTIQTAVQLHSCHQLRTRFEGLRSVGVKDERRAGGALIGLGDLCRLRAEYDDAEKLLQRALAVILRRLPGEAVPLALTPRP